MINTTLHVSQPSHYLSFPGYLCSLLVALRGIRALVLPLRYLRAHWFQGEEGVRVEHTVQPRVRQALGFYEEADACDAKNVETTTGY
jgi:hypothetical protein